MVKVNHFTMWGGVVVRWALGRDVLASPLALYHVRLMRKEVTVSHNPLQLVVCYALRDGSQDNSTLI